MTTGGVETQHVPDLPRFGRYRALAPLGSGATGTVYRAEDEVLGRPVAIKVLHAHGDPGLRERFLREARAFGAVHHPNILAIYDAGAEGQAPYLVMELAPGGALRERIAAGPLPVDAVRRLGIQISRALAASHAAAILHRDVKPANILAVEEDRWKLADFGIARLPDSKLTVAGQFLGSPSYAAPESLRAGEFSAASDVYGLGATLYEALAGSPPHGDHDMSALLRKLEAPPPPLRERRAVPPALEGAVMAALALDPAQRPSAEELAAMLAVVEDEPRAVVTAPAPAATPTSAAVATPTPIPAPAQRRSRRRLLVGAAIAGLALLIAILASGGGGSQPAASGARAIDDPDRSGGAGDPAQPGEPADPRLRDGDQDERPADERPADEPTERRGRGKGRWKKHKGR